jgi:hypothetical protein
MPALGLLALAMMCGCLPMAAPLALNAARTVVSGISSSARARKKDQVAKNAEPCSMGQRPLPQLIELRTDRVGATTYRPLNPGGSTIDPQAQQAGGKASYLGAWRPMEDLAGIHFQPPLQSQLVPSSVIFLAYAPVQGHDPAEESQLDALNRDFGPTSGIFDWNDRVYLYSAVRQLPCESAEVPAAKQSLRDHAQPESPEEPEAPH